MAQIMIQNENGRAFDIGTKVDTLQQQNEQTEFDKESPEATQRIFNRLAAISYETVR